MKICTKCKIEREVSEFYVKNDKKKPRLTSKCKICWNNYYKNYTDPEIIRERKRQSEFKHRDKIAERKRKYYLENKERLDLKHNIWNENNKDRIKNNYYIKHYGITLEQYNELCEKQKYRCAICKRHRDEFTQNLAVDHNHETMEIRGLLCNNCNHRVIGRHKDAELLKAAYEYLLGPYTGFLVPKKKKKLRVKKKDSQLESI